MKLPACVCTRAVCTTTARAQSHPTGSRKSDRPTGTDPIQNMYLEKVREYTEKSKYVHSFMDMPGFWGGILLGPTMNAEM